jgi:hypothetical protein
VLTWINSNWASQPYVPYPSSNIDAKAAFNEFKEKPEFYFSRKRKKRNMYENNATGLNYVKHENKALPGIQIRHRMPFIYNGMRLNRKKSR